MGTIIDSMERLQLANYSLPMVRSVDMMYFVQRPPTHTHTHSHAHTLTCTHTHSCDGGNGIRSCDSVWGSRCGGCGHCQGSHAERPPGNSTIGQYHGYRSSRVALLRIKLSTFCWGWPANTYIYQTRYAWRHVTRVLIVQWFSESSVQMGICSNPIGQICNGPYFGNRPWAILLSKTGPIIGF